MAYNSQGIQIYVLSSAAAVNSGAATSLYLDATALRSTAAHSFVADGFTTDMWLQLNTKSTELRKIKSVSATSIALYGRTTASATGTTALVAYGFTGNQVGEVTDFTGPGGQAAVIDITSLNSTAKEKAIGLRDEGQLNLTLNYAATDAGQEVLQTARANREALKYVIILTDQGTKDYPSWCYFSGYCVGFSISGKIDDKVSANSVIEISGPVVWATAST